MTCRVNGHYLIASALLLVAFAMDTVVISIAYVFVSFDRGFKLRKVDEPSAVEVDSAYHRTDLFARQLDVQAGDHPLELPVCEIAIALGKKKKRNGACVGVELLFIARTLAASCFVLFLFFDLPPTTRRQ